MRKALISVSDKTKIVELARALVQNGFEILSTGGTKKTLEENKVPVIAINDFTGFPEILDGRVKTLHPKVHGALLNVRSNPKHQAEIKLNNIDNIDLVVVNLYPFQETISKPKTTLEEAIENIDIGGPSMLRSAAKNFQSVTVLTDPNDYEQVIAEIAEKGDTKLETREKLAAKVFRKTAYYDALISNYLSNKFGETLPETITVGFTKHQDLRYGENPHQAAAFYKDTNTSLSLASGHQIQGKELSYNNIQDGNAAIQIVSEFNDLVVVGLKHMNPCGVGIGKTVEEAWDRCYEGDSVSIFGGIVATNAPIDGSTAAKMSTVFLEIVIAPDFTTEALAIFAKKKNLRVIKLDLDKTKISQWQVVSVNGGILYQEWDRKNVDDCTLEVVTIKQPAATEMIDLKMGQKVVKHVKSNAIVIVKDQIVIGVGAGQMNRVGAAKIALEWAQDRANGAIMASDAFFPFEDIVELASKYNIKAIIQPGGSIRDTDSITLANKKGIAMVFTKMRHFKH